MKKGDEKSMMVRISRKIYIPIYVMIFILLGVVLYIKYTGLPLNKYVFILVIVFIFMAIKYTEVHRFSIWYKITEHSLIHKQGIFNRKIKNLDLSAISDIDVSQNFWQRMFRYGNLNVRLFSDVSHTEIKNINDPERFANFLQQARIAKGIGGLNV